MPNYLITEKQQNQIIEDRAMRTLLDTCTPCLEIFLPRFILQHSRENNGGAFIISNKSTLSDFFIPRPVKSMYHCYKNYQEALEGKVGTYGVYSETERTFLNSINNKITIDANLKSKMKLKFFTSCMINILSLILTTAAFFSLISGISYCLKICLLVLGQSLRMANDTYIGNSIYDEVVDNNKQWVDHTGSSQSLQQAIIVQS